MKRERVSARKEKPQGQNDRKEKYPYGYFYKGFGEQKLIYVGENSLQIHMGTHDEPQNKKQNNTKLPNLQHFKIRARGQRQENVF